MAYYVLLVSDILATQSAFYFRVLFLPLRVQINIYHHPICAPEDKTTELLSGESAFWVLLDGEG